MNETEITQRTLDATMRLFWKRIVAEQSISLIAEEAGITSKDILSVFRNIEEIFTGLSERTIAQLKDETQAIAAEGGLEALNNLINKHIHYFFNIELNLSYIPTVHASDHARAIENFSSFFNQYMPELYISFFERNRDLLPDTKMDLKYYAYFIAHSMDFFKQDILETYAKNIDERKSITRDIIASLFGIEELELN